MSAPPAATSAAFAGFWMGGYESADHINGSGVPLDMAQASGHLDRLEEDHARAAEAGLRCVRESIGWRLAEGDGGRIDLDRAERIARSAQRHGLQVLWTVMHYGLPGDLSLHDDALISRFAVFAAEVARVLGKRPAGARPPVYTPINEIGYLAWAASQPDLLAAPNNMAGADPDSSRISGYGIKRRLVRAALAAMAAMRRVDAQARFLQVEPVVHVVAPVDRPELAPLAAEIRSWQWQAWDLLAGFDEPELGGHPALLDLLGVNHYHSSQWEVGTERRLPWHLRDRRRMPVSALLAETWQRYGRPLVVAETGHIGVGRAAWLHEMASEVRRARSKGVPVEGLCLYPLVDRPDWNLPQRWHRCGLWHVDTAQAAGSARLVDQPSLAALRAWQAVLPWVGDAGAAASATARADAESGARAVAQTAAAPLLLALSSQRWAEGRRGTALLSRLAGPWRIVFVEEPRAEPGPPRLDCIAQGPHTEVLVPCLPHPLRGFAEPLLQTLLQAWCAEQGVQRPLAWVDTAQALPLAQALLPRALVCDSVAGVADASDVSNPSNASNPSNPWNAEALAAADLLLTPGPALHPRQLCLPDGVDATALQALQPGGWDAEEVARLQAGVPRPRLGLLGADACTPDLPLLAALADARPQWQLLVPGPLNGMTAADLPQRPNIHWLGEPPHRLLPELLAGWDLALHLPAGLKTLPQTQPVLALAAALAAGLPLVAQGGSGQGQAALQRCFAACEAALAETAQQRSARQSQARGQAVALSWDALAATLAGRLAAFGARFPSGATARPPAAE